jgi:hypothetical protein
MKTTLIIIVLSGLLASRFCPQQTYAAGSEEATQLWWMAGVEQRLDYALGIRVETETRIATGGSAFRRNEVRPWLTWDYSPRHHFQLGYENSVTDRPGELEVGHDVIAAWDVRIPFGGWNVNSRQRIQYGLEGEEETGLFRHRVDLMWMESRLPFRLSPYVFNEWFLDFLGGDFRQNRVGLGLAYPATDHIGFSIFAMRWDRWMPNGEHLVTPVVGFQTMMRF